MEIEKIDLYSLKDVSDLSRIKCEDFSEAAAVCLDNCGHQSGVVAKIEGDYTTQFALIWGEVSQQMKDTRKDMQYTVESGAYAIAMLIIEKLIGLRVTQQSQKMTGFDYWLGNPDSFGFQNKFRLEVSGILKGSQSIINYRTKEKLEQTKKSDNLNIPALIVIVEFSGPFVKVKERWNK